MHHDLFGVDHAPRSGSERLADGTVFLHGFVLPKAEGLLSALKVVTDAAPFRHMVTLGGFRMSVALGPACRLSLHQDKNEHDSNASIVSISLGIPAMFLVGGQAREGKTLRLPLFHGDVLVWGGPDRLRYHGITPLELNHHPATGCYRLNLTFRKVG